MEEATVILLVDEDLPTRKLTSFVLEESGYTVVHVANGSQALDAVRKKRIDLAVIEWHLSDMPGTELCRLLKNNYFNHMFVPVLMLTGRSQLQDRVEGLRIGADDYILKPYEPSELLARIEVMLRIKKQSFEWPKSEEANEHAVKMRFEFPEPVKVACEQYLLYFAEFLRDLGMPAIAEIREEAGQVLFSVQPEDKDEALDNIREALEVYLRLPTNRNNSIVITPETSIEVQKLSAQLGILQSQFYLANAALQQKELTLQHKDQTIQQQQVLIQQHITSGKLLIQAIQEVISDEGGAEPVVGDIVKIKKWNWEAIEIDLPELGVVLVHKPH